MRAALLGNRVWPKESQPGLSNCVCFHLRIVSSIFGFPGLEEKHRGGRVGGRERGRLRCRRPRFLPTSPLCTTSRASAGSSVEKGLSAWPDWAVDACHHCEPNGSVTAVALGLKLKALLPGPRSLVAKCQGARTHCPVIWAHFLTCNCGLSTGLEPNAWLPAGKENQNSSEILERDNRALDSVCGCPGSRTRHAPIHAELDARATRLRVDSRSGVSIFMTL